ncbi:GINS complex, Sld5 component [Rickenella mellea]|uniref:DNA replication complex GINS protein SLD5 n=1 Tax=Rickenella mellea TaxID=50990 RepID=A0A4Y7PNY9_9AGAM|nr:GINS complex, Sld5 component [Rickenella mellea]
MNIDNDVIPGLFADPTQLPKESDLQELLRLWQNERHAPEILPSNGELLSRVLDQIRRQSDDANALRRDANLSEEEHYMTMLVQTEVERVKFIIRSYIRTRLFKIEQFARHMTNDPEIQARLSQAELTHARRYTALVEKQFTTSVLGHLPDTQRGLDDDVPTLPNMVTEPDKDRPVFIHARQACGPVQLPDGSGFEIANDSIHLMRYHTIEQLLARGEVELV